MTRKIEIYPVNRVEGDLEIAIELEDDVVIDARSAGTMYRGFENIMVGRAPLDGLVITPRICGICSTAHLYAAASALDMLFNVEVPRQAAWIRSVTSMAEMLQNGFRPRLSERAPVCRYCKTVCLDRRILRAPGH